MESSEDDAGAATNASRRASAREKDVGLAEDVNATSSFQQEPSEARPSCETPAMSEDNFDGDSVPSPSAQDVNTSTEAILDMIDEIVDGPGAPKRVPLASEFVETRFDELEIISEHANIIQESTKSECEDSFAPPVVASSADSAKSEPLLEEAGKDSQAESSSISDKSPDTLNANSVDSLPESLSLPESNEPAVFTQPEDSQTSSLSEEVPEAPVACPPPEVGPQEPARSPATNEVPEAPSSPPCNVVPEAPASCSLPNVVPEAPTSCPPPIPSSSEEKTVQNNSDVSACETQEQTVKCVSSSDSRDNVTVESAESTSSDSSVSEGKAVLVEPQVRSPLRRRLIRPAPSDRRPDSTVSSTVDSQVVHLPATEQKSSESITKDVTSSSDAVPTIHGNVKPEEIRNVSEINFCKAETSVSPPKKIKLIRQKVITGTSNRESSVNQSAIQSDKDQCQSTSSDNNSILLPEPQIESSNTVSVPQSQDVNQASTVSNCVSEKPVKSPEQSLCSVGHSQPSIEHQLPNQDAEKHIENEQVAPAEPSIRLPNASEPISEADVNTSEIVQEVSSMPEPSPAELPEEVKLNDIGQSSEHSVDHDICKDSKEETTQNEVLIPENTKEDQSNVSTSENSEPENTSKEVLPDQQKVPPIKLNLSMSNLSESKLEAEQTSISKNSVIHEESEVKQVPKLTIKLKQPDEVKSPVPKVTIKPIRPPVDQNTEDLNEKVQPVPSVTKLNIKPILKPPENSNEKSIKSQHGDDRSINSSEQLPCITKLNIKPIPKPPEKINDIHRKSSSSEISESEYSENDETSTSDQASTSDQGPSDVVPKVTIKLGKPGTESEGKFYTEKNVPKLTIKGFQSEDNEESEPKLKLVISQSELSSDTQPEKIPKLTIKTVSKSESQPLSPKLTIKPIKPPDTTNKDEIPKIKISTESFTSSSEFKESSHVPKITIKPVTRSSTAMCDSPEHIPVVTKLNIKPIVKPTDSGEPSEDFDDKVPVVSKLNIKPVIKPKDNDVDSSVDDVPKITKLNIKPIKNPEENSSEEKDCDEMNADIDENSIPVVTKINIKPIIKPQDEETLKDSENQSSETGNSSDDNGDHIPVVTKLNIKPIIKPDSLDESSKTVSSSEQSIPVVTKLNIKPLVKPGESISPSSPKKEHSKIDGLSPIIPVVTKLNIKPIVRPEEAELAKSKDESVEKTIVKNPPLVMKINMKTMAENYNNEHACNNFSDETLSMSPKSMKVANALENKTETCLENKNIKRTCETVNDVTTSVKEHSAEEKCKQNCVPDLIEEKKESDDRAQSSSVNEKPTQSANAADNDSLVTGSNQPETGSEKNPNIVNESPSSKELKNINYASTDGSKDSSMKQTAGRQKMSSLQNCILLKKLLESTKPSIDKGQEAPSTTVNYDASTEKNDNNVVNSDHLDQSENSCLGRNNSGIPDINEKKSPTPDRIKDSNKALESDIHSSQELRDKPVENVTKPLEIIISDKITNQSSGQDSPRIILKINKTDHGPSAKIITEDVVRPETQQNYTENTQEILNDKQSPKKYANSRRKQTMDTSLNLSTGKRLRSSRIVENTEKTPIAKRNMGKRPSTTETSPTQNKESDLSLLQSKRLKLGQLLSNKSLSITPVSKSPPSPTKSSIDMKQGVKTVNHALLNNENCSKNGNSKLHNILSNLQAQQMQSLPYSLTNCSEKAQTVASDIELNASVSNSDAVEIAHVENSHPELQEMIINENSDYRDLTAPEEVSQDPLEVKPAEEPPEIVDIPKPVELTPQPKKRGRPRKLPVSEGAKPVTLPVPALEERPQRSLRLMRDRPTILQKPRGRGRGRGGRRVETTPPTELETIVVIEPADEPEDRPPAAEIDPTSSRIKLPRMTEALDNMPSSCVTPLSSRRRNSSGNFSSETPELKVMVEGSKLDEFTKTPEACGSARGRGSRGGRGGRGRTPRGRGRGRGGGRGAMYMKETMGIYGRVCGPATTTVQLFEEETCMMDDNATPAKPSHLLDEDSQSSVKSSTNDSNKLKKSKFADLFDSNKVWTAADVKEYTWPPPDKADVEHKVMMIQEQVAMFLGVKSFKRRYAELQRRTISGEERDYVLSKGLVTEALCDLGITAVDASEVLDIMLSDYPHKYEEYRSHQRQRQLTETVEEPVVDVKTEEKVVKVEMKPEKPVEHKPELPKIDPEKTRQDMAMAAIASASEWNARNNALRRGACADLQSLTVLRPRPAPRAPARPHLRPPAGFYPHALLPGQYQHSYRVYTPDQLRYFPLNTVVAAPPAPASEDWSSESEPDWGSRFSSSDDSDVPTHHSAKRKKLTKTKRSSHTEVGGSSKEDSRATEEVDLCRVCKMRLEANRRYTHERFLVCAHCNAKLHPSCLELSADTIRKCREYAWQCAECKSCCACRQPADDDKMLFCDLCDRGFHIYCVGLDTVPSGRWHCVECAVCKSCGARAPGGDWHHQTRRGPGGHKLYSHSLCTPCARAYRIGRYCPLCERSFIGPKGTMQLVICKLCDRQLHQECVRQTVSSLNVLDYTCAECRRGGITSRAAAVRLAPRTIATLFMAKRRFNKYAHRQYLASRQRDAAAAADPAPERVDVLHDGSDASEPAEPDPSDPLDAAV
nr:microtubule-associated protein futsch isoform X1 [Helicoverpa armigera]XP_049700434.1 microtubule-associated protein futsch isoform X1 [Helicoverpa armigera]XP_049700435.1 microtubule-associated protein futsch isoform X1 [Helicoverpa armigera]